MSVDFESAARLASLKQGIEAKTGETYPDLTGGVNALIAGFGQGGGGSDYESGTLVLDVNSNKISIPTTKKYTHIAIWYLTTEIPEGWTIYQNIAAFGIDGYYLAESCLNYNATSFQGGLRTASTYDPVSGPYLEFNESSIDMITKTTGTNLQVFVAGAEYEWMAW